MIEEELAEKAEIAKPSALPTAVDVEKGDGRVTIDFIAWRMEKGAFGTMSGEGLKRGEIAEAEFADVDHV